MLKIRAREWSDISSHQSEDAYDNAYDHDEHVNHDNSNNDNDYK